MPNTITVKDLYRISDAFTDELQDVVQGVNYANQAIARINTRIGLVLPFFAGDQDPYDALNINWLKTLVIPYMNWGIKMNDGSLNEADRYLAEFMLALDDFEDVAIGGEADGSGGVVDVAYIDQNALKGKIAQIDFRALNKNSDFWW